MHIGWSEVGWGRIVLGRVGWGWGWGWGGLGWIGLGSKSPILKTIKNNFGQIFKKIFDFFLGMFENPSNDENNVNWDSQKQLSNGQKISDFGFLSVYGIES